LAWDEGISVSTYLFLPAPEGRILMREVGDEEGEKLKRAREKGRREG
jgi:hypothetical protein